MVAEYCIEWCDSELFMLQVERLRRRVSELEAACDALGEGKVKPRQAGDRFKRERDLEGVVEGLQKVCTIPFTWFMC